MIWAESKGSMYKPSALAWSLSLDSADLISLGQRGQKKNVDPYLSHFTDLLSHYISYNYWVFAPKSDSILHLRPFTVFYPLHSCNSARLFPSHCKLPLLWIEIFHDFFHETRFYPSASQTAQTRREQGNHHSEPHWFGVCCTSDI